MQVLMVVAAVMGSLAAAVATASVLMSALFRLLARQR